MWPKSTLDNNFNISDFIEPDVAINIVEMQLRIIFNIMEWSADYVLSETFCL